MAKIKRALISVWDKRNLDELAGKLVSFGVEIIATGNTAQYLSEKGIKTINIGDITGFPEILEGRVKTMHPKIYGGILAKRDKASHLKEIEEHQINFIDLVVVNLYPFEATVAKPEVSLEEALENIDIGGPAMVRAAAKNFPYVGIIVDPDDYRLLMEELDAHQGELSLEFRKRMAIKAFKRTKNYDSAIISYLSGFPEEFTLKLEKVYDLRYGENPHQKAALYRIPEYSLPSLTKAEILHGKELSFNNINDLNAAWELVSEFSSPAAAIIKHTNPCGVATADEISEAFKLAFECDPLSAFGGIVAFNRVIKADLARAINEAGFLEAIIAPAYEKEAFEILKTKKNRRLVRADNFIKSEGLNDYDMKHIPGGMLLQQKDNIITPIEEWELKTNRRPTEQELGWLQFAWRVCKYVKSNAIVLVKGTATVGIGAGQMSRVDSVFLATKKAGERAKGAVMASDAFFPFRDSVDTAAKAGITAIVQPGGSVRDQESIDACNEHNIAMLFTGKRHFRH